MWTPYSDEYSENRYRISSMCKTDRSNSGFLGFGIDDEKANKEADDVINIMARNYAIVEELQGHEITYFNRPACDKGEKKTVGDFVTRRLKPYITTPTTGKV